MKVSKDPDPANYPKAITYPRPKIKQKSESSSLKKIEEISVSNIYRRPVQELASFLFNIKIKLMINPVHIYRASRKLLYKTHF